MTNRTQIDPKLLYSINFKNTSINQLETNTRIIISMVRYIKTQYGPVFFMLTDDNRIFKSNRRIYSSIGRLINCKQLDLYDETKKIYKLKGDLKSFLIIVIGNNATYKGYKYKNVYLKYLNLDDKNLSCVNDYIESPYNPEYDIFDH